MNTVKLTLQIHSGASVEILLAHKLSYRLMCILKYLLLMGLGTPNCVKKTYSAASRLPHVTFSRMTRTASFLS